MNGCDLLGESENHYVYNMHEENMQDIHLFTLKEIHTKVRTHALCIYKKLVLLQSLRKHNFTVWDSN